MRRNGPVTNKVTRFGPNLLARLNCNFRRAQVQSGAHSGSTSIWTLAWVDVVCHSDGELVWPIHKTRLKVKEQRACFHYSSRHRIRCPLIVAHSDMIATRLEAVDNLVNILERLNMFPRRHWHALIAGCACMCLGYPLPSTYSGRAETGPLALMHGLFHSRHPETGLSLVIREDIIYKNKLWGNLTNDTQC
ncbi:hypothetical protein VNO77_04142 [Canavalia gladiata]|uniref:Uncharacterized protein n=1 Tax=Canavalia gladiata TaxID=3824 RepID=A0AAN9RCW8_CANGL